MRRVCFLGAGGCKAAVGVPVTGPPFLMRHRNALELADDGDPADRTIEQRDDGHDQQSERRLKNLKHLRRIFGGPIAPLPPEEALADVEAVNRILGDNRQSERRVLEEDSTTGDHVNTRRHHRRRVNQRRDWSGAFHGVG